MEKTNCNKKYSIKKDNKNYLVEYSNLIEKNELLQKQNEILRKKIEQLEKNCYLDSLTEVYNSRGFEQILGNYANTQKFLAISDVDNFKTVNDTYGHSVGNLLLKQIAQIMRQNTRNNDVICRFGGDEFIILFSNCKFEIVKRRIEEIQKAVEVLGLNYNLNIGLSAGIVEFDDSLSYEENFKIADDFLYDSKNGCKGSVCYEKTLKL